ncbi:hypothetical protein C2845_PM05G20580 [Panicum miliaceum]|uniref:EGF-like calcium-binding domain-containing protein n=1 Tax=Panicum miliaceum TaxID=4540 RepID=A0A3L6T0Q8_PANMI|nr:hypothetical protein C2845_PM05G20580 [Panicum miliaceum]
MDVVVENLRQLCVHRVANASNRPWVWWDYVADYHLRCSMENRYTRRCPEDFVRSLDMETDECLDNNGGCWRDEKTNITACKDTYRGRICQCPVVGGVQYQGDGYNECKDVDECSEKLACSCPHCSCKNSWGGFDCKCGGGLMSRVKTLVLVSPSATFLFLALLLLCSSWRCCSRSISSAVERAAKNMSAFGWLVTALVVSCLAGAGVAGYVFYKYRLRRYMDSEIMAQYMPQDWTASTTRASR